MNKNDINKIVSAVADACKAQGCVLTGGETSEQPGVLQEGTYILTSSIVGVVDKDKIIDGSKIKQGDVVISIESSGIHTNGYTLVRRIMKEFPAILEEKVENKTFIDSILEPHRCYYNSLKDLFDLGIINGMAHITGGGIKENLNRILPDNVDAVIDLSKYNVLEIFKLLKRYGNISDEEMLRTFNLGVGLTVVCNKDNADQIIEHVNKFNYNAYIIGNIEAGKGKVEVKNNLKFN